MGFDKMIVFRPFQKNRVVSVFLLLSFLFLSAFSSMANDKFSIQHDGMIQVGELQFAHFNEYVVSDYFRDNGKRCGTRTPAITEDDRTARSVNDCTLQLTRIQDEYWPLQVLISIPLMFHVLYNTSGTGNISDEAIRNQVTVLNEDFAAMAGTMGSQGYDTKIRFTLAGITRTQNDSWFNDNPGYAAALGKDPKRFVNIYTNTASGNLGYATFPQESAGQERDGIVMAYQTIGGRNNGNQLYDQGRTLVHEMGHYLGLFHTFEGYNTCINSYSGGDLIVDTNAENQPHYQCVQTATCGSSDPIRNYMNYTPDSCMIKFTQEQANRMVCSLLNYRPDLLASSIVPNALTPLLLSQ